MEKELFEFKKYFLKKSFHSANNEILFQSLSILCYFILSYSIVEVFSASKAQKNRTNKIYKLTQTKPKYVKVLSHFAVLFIVRP